MDVARSAAREVVKQHVAGVEEVEPSQENVTAVATREMVDISLSALRMGRAKSTSFAWSGATKCRRHSKRLWKPKLKASSCIRGFGQKELWERWPRYWARNPAHHARV